jgi:predicted alpha/beta superfamily hydrolase
MILLGLAWSIAEPCAAQSGKPIVLGTVEEIKSVELGEKRSINIYLPEGYSEDDTTHYPVIYLLDGGTDEDFIHVVGLVQFSSFPWINRVPRSIVVGITNVDRKRDFTFPSSVAKDKQILPTGGHSDRFISFIDKELQPYIAKKYRATDTKTLIGESLGGLLATEILLTKPTLFNKYVIISPSLWWDGGSILDRAATILQESFTQSTDVYIAVGKEGLTPGEPPRVMEVDANVLADKLKTSKSKALQVWFDYLPQENHATVAHQATLNAFKSIYYK